MIKFEFVKKLKEEGFPQTLASNMIYDEEGKLQVLIPEYVEKRGGKEGIRKDCFYIPEAEEFMRDVKGRLLGIRVTHFNDGMAKFTAYELSPIMGVPSVVGEGMSLTESLAVFWLGVNEKKKWIEKNQKAKLQKPKENK